MNKYNTYKKFRFRTDLQYKSKKVNRGKQKMTGHEVVIKSVLTPRSLFFVQVNVGDREERYHQSFDFEFNQQSSSPSLKQKTFFSLLTNIPFKFKESENLPMCVLLA